MTRKPTHIPAVSLRVIVVCAVAALILPACETPQNANTTAVAEARPADETSDHWHRNDQRQPLRMDHEANTARRAAMRVASMPPIEDALLRREIRLYAALYEAAYESNVGDFTEHYLLDPSPEKPQQWYPDELAMDERDFALRVLAELATLDVPIAWTPAEKQDVRASPVNFPRTRHLATRLRIRILERDEDRATVRADVSDFTAHVGGSRQRVEAIWDGEAWRIIRRGPRTVW